MICPFCREKIPQWLTQDQQRMELQLEEGEYVLVGRQRFTTFERVQFRELTVIKNGRRTPFDREKLAKSLFTALKKRPIDLTLLKRLSLKYPENLRRWDNQKYSLTI